MAKYRKGLDRRGFSKTSGAGLAGAACPPMFAKPIETSPSSAPSSHLSWEDQMRLRRLQPVRSIVGGVPVYSFGDTFIYGHREGLWIDDDS